MSTSPVSRGRRFAVRVVIFVITIFASISASTAVVGLDPGEIDTTTTTTTPESESALAVTTTTTTRPPLLLLTSEPCTDNFADFCVEVAAPAPTAPEVVGACTTGVEHTPQGTLSVVPGGTDQSPADAVRVRIEIEDGLAVDDDCFAAETLNILTDPRGWVDIANVTFVRVDDDSYDLRLVLASPAKTDRLCYPARTGGKFSCRNGTTVIINLMRWESGTDEYIGDMTTYRRYLINHEVGHFLGEGHMRCPGPGEPAPVMMQQTKGLGQCLPNGWPTQGEH